METFIKNKLLGREQRMLPAKTYNVIKHLLHQNKHRPVFVPVRSMQYQAIIDTQEVIFVDVHRRPFIEFSWQKFSPQIRENLTDPVPYQFVHYEPQAIETMKRMQGEFFLFAYQLNERKKESEQLNKQNNKVVPFQLPKK